MKICEKRQRILCLEIYKTSNKLNPGFMNDIFKLWNADRLTREKYNSNSENQTTFGARSLMNHGPKIWNVLPYHIKTLKN